MNKHVLLVLKWLKNPDSVSREEIDEHYESLEYPVFHGSPEYELETAYFNIDLSYICDDLQECIDETKECIDEYFRLSGENRADYEKAI